MSARAVVPPTPFSCASRTSRAGLESFNSQSVEYDPQMSEDSGDGLYIDDDGNLKEADHRDDNSRRVSGEEARDAQWRDSVPTMAVLLAALPFLTLWLVARGDSGFTLWIGSCVLALCGAGLGAWRFRQNAVARFAAVLGIASPPISLITGLLTDDAVRKLLSEVSAAW